jgi:hypothetical protein
MSGVGQRLKGHATGNGPVTDDGNDFAINTLLLRRQGHTHCGRNAG